MVKTVRAIEICQQIAHGFTADVAKSIVDGWDAVEHYAYITHDKDDKVDKDGNRTPKAPHVHLMVKFKYPYPVAQILARCAKVGANMIAEQQLEKVKKWVAAVAYLTHENAPEKHRYERSEVVASFAVDDAIEKALEGGSGRLEYILAGIDKGEIRAYNLYDYVTCEEYVKFERQIKAAQSYRRLRLAGKVERDMKAVFITGASGAGKTTLAKRLAADAGYSVFISSGSNDPLDGYNGQDAIILDDLRPSVLHLADLLKMLDNNTASSVPSRYFNKWIEAKCIYITTTLDINTFFSKVFENDGEAAVQLRRRCTTIYKLAKEWMMIGVYASETDNYVMLAKVPNPIAIEYGKMTEDRAKELAEESLRSTLRALGVPSDEIERQIAAAKDGKGSLDSVNGWMDAPDNMENELGFK